MKYYISETDESEWVTETDKTSSESANEWRVIVILTSNTTLEKTFGKPYSFC